MIRRLNFTGRRRIARSRVTVRLATAPDGHHDFGVEHDLDGLGFPADARVFVEAYNALSYMRFDFGTVGERRAPADTRLVEITARPLPRFRLKVVDRRARLGLLLGVADAVVPLRADEDAAHRQPLLPVEFRDLGDRVWRLELDDWPVLELNHRVDGIADEARSGEAFLALVFPEVVRRILHAIVIERAQTDPDFDEDDWTSLWLRYACALPGVGRPPESVAAGWRADRLAWIDDAVEAFCRSRRARTRFAAAIARDAGAGR